jgi:hypothetical protein
MVQRHKKVTQTQIINSEYVLKTGDYLRLFNGNHSGLFVSYIDSSTDPSDSTKIKTIEGNTGSRVNVKTRTLGDLTSVGNTR